MEEFQKGHGDIVDDEHYISSSDIWSVRDYHKYFRGHAACMSPGSKGSREEHLPLVEFAHNNSYQASIHMAPYEGLYGRPCRSSICWTEVGESSIIGPDLIRDTSEKVGLIQKRLLTAQSR